MGKPTAFLERGRVEPPKDSPNERLRTYDEHERRFPVEVVREQASRCMACGIPFCHAACPLRNRIPDWNDHVYRGRFDRATAALFSTNDFPEITGRVCPAPCEASCVLELHGAPVSIKAVEREIADRWLESPALDEAATALRREVARTGQRVAVVGSGPAGLACAVRLARGGHDVSLYERDDRVGGLLRYGIPDFKLDKRLIDRRVSELEALGVIIHTGVDVGRDVTLGALRREHDAVVLTLGATVPRDLPLPGRISPGIHFAMDFLVGQNRVVAGDLEAPPIDAKGRRVVILGGGDTGSDCLGTALRQGAKHVTQVELLPRPPDQRAPEDRWPDWPLLFRTSSSQDEGGERYFALRTERFALDARGHVRALSVNELDFGDARDLRAAVPVGPPRELDADLVLLALGFTGPDTRGFSDDGVELDARGLLEANERTFETSVPGVFACGDARRGQSLVVWALAEGRDAAERVDAYLRARRRVG